MLLSNLPHAITATCHSCSQKAGIISLEHQGCRWTYQVGWDEMVSFAAQAAGSPTFDDKTLRLVLAETVRRCYGDGNTVNRALEEIGKQGV